MIRPRTALAALTTTVVVGLLVSGCAGGTASAGPATDTIRTTIDIPGSFDPTLTQSLPDFLLARTSYDTLVRKDATGLVPGLAASWTSTPTQAVFTLRSGATCSDGTPITPTVVRNSLDYLARPGSGSTVPGQVFGPGSTPTITADDSAGTVTIDLPSPWPDLVTGLSISSTGIICPKGLADPTGLAAGTVKGSESGPYTLQSFEPGVRYTYALRDGYNLWPQWTTTVGGTPAKTLQYVVSADSTATANLVMSGQLDIAKIQAQTMDRFSGMEGYNVSVNRFSDFYLIYNERPGSPFTDPKRRLGVAQALDRSMFEKVTSLGTGELSTSLAASTVPCVPASNPVIPTQNTDAAKAALNGVKIRFIGPQIAGPNGAGNEYIAEALRAAGADVTIENTDVGTWISKVLGAPGDWDLTMYADLNFPGSLANALGSFVSPSIQDGGGNIGAVQNATADSEFGAALTATDDQARCTHYDAAVDALISDGDVLPLVNDAYIYVQRPGFTVQMLGGAVDDPIFRIAG